MKLPIVGLALALIPTLFSCGNKDADHSANATAKLVFSAIPDQDETRLRQKFQPVAEYLSGRLGVPVEYVHCTRYEDAVELFKNGDVQLAWFGGLTGAQARSAVPGARAIAQGKEDPKFYSYFIANKEAGIAANGDQFPDLAGKSFAFGSKLSTSGRLMPEFFIRENTGKSPEELFSSFDFSGDHEKTCELVEAGQFQAGVVNYKVYDRRVAEGKTDPDVCQVIWKTPMYADYNFTAHPSLEKQFGSGFIGRLQAALTDMSDPALLSAFDREKLIPAQDSDFAAIDKLGMELGFIH